MSPINPVVLFISIRKYGIFIWIPVALLVIGLLLHNRFGLVWEKRSLAADSMQQSAGYKGAYAYTVLLGTTWMSQDKRGTSAPAQVREDGIPLAQPDSLHADIASKGAGRYSLWGGALYFSTSDNSDPRSNGRKYDVYWPMPINPVFVWVIYAGIILMTLLMGWSYWEWINRMCRKLAKVLLLCMVSLSMVLLLNVIAALIVVLLPKPKDQVVSFEGAKDQRIGLAVFVDKPQARKIFHDFYQVTEGFVPFVDWRAKPIALETTTIDERGLRTNRRAVVPGQRSLHFFGGSTMWGTGVDDQNTIPSQVQQLMGACNVYNHASSGWVSRQSLHDLIEYSVNGSAMDVVIFYDGVNEVAVLTRGDMAIDGHVYTSIIENAVERARGQNDLPFLKTIVGGGVLKLAERLSRPKPTTGLSDNARLKRIAESLVAIWDTAHALTTARGGRFYALLQPVASVGNPNVTYLSEQQAFYLKSEYNKVYEHVRQIARDRKLTYFYDLSLALDGDGQYYMDWSHINAGGNRVIAERIVQIMSSDSR